MAIEALNRTSPDTLGANFLQVVERPWQEKIDSPVEVYVLNKPDGRINVNGVNAVCTHLLNGEIVIGDYLTTYGIMFLEKSRDKVRLSKGENENKPVSVAARLSDALKWIDKEQVHPDFRDDEVVAMLGTKLTDIGFLRFPVNDNGRKISQYSVDRGQMQVLFKHETDPILARLTREGLNAYLLTSLNPHKQLERYQPPLAFSFAEQIRAKAFILNTNHFLNILTMSPEYYDEDLYDTRLKKGSVPIVQLPRLTDVNYYTKTPIFTILRGANTHEYSVKMAIKQLFPYADVRYSPEKPEIEGRPHFSLPQDARGDLWEVLYNASLPQKK